MYQKMLTSMSSSLSLCSGMKSLHHTRTEWLDTRGLPLLPVFQQIHMFTCVYSFGVVILLMGLLTVLYKRHLKYDLRKGSIGDEEDDKAVGWKHIHGDTFRCLTNLPLLSAVVGSGTQLLFIQYSETGMEQSVLLAGIIFFLPVLLTTFSLNILAAYFRVTAALPLGTIFVIFLYVHSLQFHYLSLVQWLDTVAKLKSNHLPSQRKSQGRFRNWFGTVKPLSKCFLEVFYHSVPLSWSFTSCVQLSGAIKSGSGGP